MRIVVIYVLQLMQQSFFFLFFFAQSASTDPEESPAQSRPSVSLFSFSESVALMLEPQQMPEDKTLAVIVKIRFFQLSYEILTFKQGLSSHGGRCR